MPDHLYILYIPNIQFKHFLVMTATGSSCPTAFSLGEETNPHLGATSFQGVQRATKSPPSLHFISINTPRAVPLHIPRHTCGGTPLSREKHSSTTQQKQTSQMSLQRTGNTQNRGPADVTKARISHQKR